MVMFTLMGVDNDETENENQNFLLIYIYKIEKHP